MLLYCFGFRDHVDGTAPRERSGYDGCGRAPCGLLSALSNYLLDKVIFYSQCCFASATYTSMIDRRNILTHVIRQPRLKADAERYRGDWDLIPFWR